MNKRVLLMLILIYSYLYILNYLTPLGFGDDYLYSFIWQGQAMNIPISENAARISSLEDLFQSQRLHYLTWGGRTLAHSIAQFFLWVGKDIFNVFNALIGTILVIEICWCINAGRRGLNCNPKQVFWVFFALWSFTPGFAPVFLWLTGACNYLWTSVILVAFLLPFVKKYYYPNENGLDSNLAALGMFFFGILAGWTNENSAFWICLVILVFLYVLKKKNMTEKWLYTGVAGILFGYLLLLFAPGNYTRLLSVHGMEWQNLELIAKNIKTLIQIFVCHIFLWYFISKSLYSLRDNTTNEKEIGKREVFFVKVLSILSFCMSSIMVFAPEFPGRSGFPGTIWLIVAAGILLRLQKESKILLIQKNAQKFLLYIGVITFITTSAVTLRNYYYRHVQVQNFLTYVEQAKRENKDTVLTVRSFAKTSNTEYLLSGFHIIDNELTEDEKSWENVAFARYFGIKGIRVVKENSEKD